MRPDLFTIKHIPSETAIDMLKYVQSAGDFKCDNTYVIKRKKYESILILSTLSGKGFLKYGNKNYEISENQGIIIDCNEPHVYFSDKNDPWHFIWAHFKGGSSMKEVKFILDNNGPMLDMESNSKARKGILEIIKLLHSKGIYCDVQIAGILNEMVTMLMLKDLPNFNEYKIVNDTLNKAILIIEKNYSQKINIDDLSRSLFINKFDLIRKFKKYIGITPYNYLIKYRVQQAKLLFENSSLSVAEVANNVGFDDSSHFIKIFKQFENLTPLKYKELLLK